MGVQFTASTFEEAIQELASASCWNGFSDKEKYVAFVRNTVEHYAEVLGLSKLDILRSFETARDYSAPNYYQESTFPRLDTGAVLIVDNLDDFRRRFPSGQYRCPSCGGISTNAYACDSGQRVDGPKSHVCNWKAYGLFGTMGKGLRVVLKSHFLERPVVTEIFNPVENEFSSEESEASQ